MKPNPEELLFQLALLKPAGERITFLESLTDKNEKSQPVDNRDTYDFYEF